MKILVCCKRVLDTDQRIQIAGDGLSIRDDDLPFILNPFDAIAVEEALRIREARTDDVEVVGVGVGADEEKTLRTALAMGTDRALWIRQQQSLDPWNVARLLVAIVGREQPTLVLMGKQAVDDDCNQTGQMLAALLGWPQATFASKLEFLDGGMRVARETDGGLEMVRITLPAVVTVDLRLNEPRYASLPSIMKAKKKPIETIDAAELGVSVEPKYLLLKLEAASTRRSGVRVASIDELMDKLRHEAKVLD